MSAEDARERLRCWRKLRSAKPTPDTVPERVEERINFVLSRVEANTDAQEDLEEGWTGIFVEPRSAPHPRKGKTK